jgi:exodeoxyribonuclease VII large subunit
VDTLPSQTGIDTGSEPANPDLARVSLSVSQLNRAIAGSLERSFGPLRVRGELASLTRASSGHWYFTLKDSAAQVRCVMFRSRNALVDFAPRDGDELEVVALAGLYEARGEFQLGVESMRRAGQGRLFEQFLKLKERLAAEGLFDPAVKRPLPRVCFRIGVVTSLQAAALRDILTTLKRRAAYARIVVYPVPVQGAGAGARIAQMLATVSARAEVDVLILARGGGSIEDLWAFNEEVLARALRACAVPVIVGVGHESDFTIADFAADLRAPTPTAAAELATPDRQGLLDALRQQHARASRRMQALLRARGQTLDYAVRALSTPRAPIRAVQARIDALGARLRERAAWALAAPAGRLLALRSRLQAGGARSHASSVLRLEAALRALRALDPREVVARGFAIVRDRDGRVVTDAGRLDPGAALDVELAAGGLQVEVRAVRR